MQQEGLLRRAATRHTDWARDCGGCTWSGQAVRADSVAISSMAVRYPASLKLAVAHSEAGVADFELERPWMVTLLEIKLEIAKRLVDEHGQLLLATERLPAAQ